MPLRLLSLRRGVSTNGPNPISVGLSVVRSLLTRRRPRPEGDDPGPDATALADVLAHLARRGVAGLPEMRERIAAYRIHAESIDPDRLDRDTALAYWLNLYNAGALDLAARAAADGDLTVLRVPGAFTDPWAEVAGEALSLTDMEHAKIRRFGDPRVHGALVCGSASCPTLRYEPYEGKALDGQLDDQLASFLAAGGAVVTGSGEGATVRLSRVLLWYGADFVRPHRMPALLPASKSAVAHAVRRWLPQEAREAIDAGGRVEFQPYDWSLACSIG